MGISNTSSGLRSGVCTSTTRPSAPFEGQMIFETDTDRLYIWNGSAWVIPNSPSQNPTGLELITSTTLSAGTNPGINGCFTSTYDNYKVLFWDVSPSTTVDIRWRLRTSGSGNGTSNYWMENISATQSSISSFQETSQSSFRFNYAQGGSNAFGWLELVQPNLSTNTSVSFQALSYAGEIVNRSFVGFFNASTVFDGIELQVASGTVTAKLAVYGYRKS